MFDWLTSLSRFSVLINYTMWSSNLFFCIQLFPAFFIIVQNFSGSRFLRVQVFQGPDPGSGSSVWVQVLEIAFLLVTFVSFYFQRYLFSNLWYKLSATANKYRHVMTKNFSQILNQITPLI